MIGVPDATFCQVRLSKNCASTITLLSNTRIENLGYRPRHVRVLPDMHLYSIQGQRNTPINESTSAFLRVSAASCVVTISQSDRQTSLQYLNTPHYDIEKTEVERV